MDLIETHQMNLIDNLRCDRTSILNDNALSCFSYDLELYDILFFRMTRRFSHSLTEHVNASLLDFAKKNTDNLLVFTFNIFEEWYLN